jgi:hypothetical protein
MSKPSNRLAGGRAALLTGMFLILAVRFQSGAYRCCLAASKTSGIKRRIAPIGPTGRLAQQRYALSGSRNKGDVRQMPDICLVSDIPGFDFAPNQPDWAGHHAAKSIVLPNWRPRFPGRRQRRDALPW